MPRYFQILAAVLVLIGGSVVHAETSSIDPKLTATIEHLLKSVAKSECAFVRNGKEHAGTEAAKHMRAKYEHFKNEIRTPEDFIRLAGTRSLLTKKAYTVKSKDGKEVASAAWLGQLLRNYRQPNSAKPNPAIMSGACVLPTVGNPAAATATPPTSLVLPQ